MRNWKYIDGAKSVKIGNEKTQNTWTIQDARRNYDAAKKEFDEKGDLFSKRKLDEVKSIIDKEYYAAYKRLEELERKRNDNIHNKGGSGEIPYYNEAKQNYTHWGLLRETIGNDTPMEYAKQPPKIVGGNSKCGNAFSKGQVLGEEGSKKYVFGGEINGTYIVYRQPDGGTYSFSSEQEIKDWLRASKIGNSEAQELEKDVEKKDKEKVEDVEELKKTGNALGKDIYQHKLDPNQYMLVDWDKDTVTIIVNGAVRDVIKNTDKVAYAVDHVYKRVNSMNKVGNSKWEFPDGRKATVKDDGTVEIKKPRDSSLYVYKTFDKDRAERQLERKGCKKVENSIGGGVQSETVLTEAKDGSQYWVEKTSKSGQYAQYNLYYTIGQGKRHAGVFKDKESAADAGRRIIGNIKSEYEILKQDPSKMHPMYKKAYEEAMKKLAKEDEDFKKRFEKDYGVKAKNEASDDKFAYVMREFEEGKLKTPDGKVVTDPAQAKAIAYSESKKTENGLARARNAMVKNIATYKDFTRDLDKAIMLEVAGINYNNVDEQTLKQWVEQAKKDGYASAIKGLQGKKLILDVY